MEENAAKWTRYLRGDFASGQGKSTPGMDCLPEWCCEDILRRGIFNRLFAAVGRERD